MCDTFVATSRFTASGNLIFAKNSDREPVEAQAVVRLPAREPAEEQVQCTYIRVPQAPRTYEVILSKPFQMWGAEMGVNEHGLVIGNEAVFTRVRMARRNDGLTGMDLLRLALERCRTAPEARDLITQLLETYGQNACGGYRNRKFFYHNSFIIADPGEAWLLETAGKHWAARRLDPFGSISNGLTIGTDYELISEAAVDFARRQGWVKASRPFDFSRAYSDWLFTRMSSCRFRQSLTSRRSGESVGRFEPAHARDILSYHQEDEERFTPARASTSNICMHATGLTNPSQTTGSLIAEIRQAGPSTVWLTGTARPCLSVYLPFFLGGTTLSGPDWRLPGATPDDSLWWQAELLHRRLCRNYQRGRELIRQERKALQDALWRRERDLVSRGATVTELDAFSRQALDRYRSLLHRWNDELHPVEEKKLNSRIRRTFDWLYQGDWRPGTGKAWQKKAF